MQEVTKGHLTLSKDQHGWTITDNEINMAYSERNTSERPTFNMLYKAFEDRKCTECGELLGINDDLSHGYHYFES